MNKRFVFTGLFVVSIVGLAIVQYQYLRIGINLARVQFNQHIAEAGNDIKQGLYGRSQLTYLIEGVMERDSTRFNTGIDHMTDASRYYLEDFLREKLIDNQIDADFTFSLMTRDSSYYLGSSPAAVVNSGADIVYPLELTGYLPANLGQRLILELQFNHLSNYFLFQLNGLTLPSLLFLAGILIAVLWVLRTFYWQQHVLNTTHDFINNLTHELRTPVFSISLAAKILKERVNATDVQMTNTILEQTGRMSNHIDKVLELGALERSKSIMDLEYKNFRPFLANICAQFEQVCFLDQISFKFSITPEDLYMKVSVFHLENAINNLLDNARKYGFGGEISLKGERRENQLEICIHDNGPGIPEAEQEKIFRKYYRIQAGNRQDVRGYGLGLSYVKTVLERHNGRIFVKSDTLFGTTFIVRLPLENYGN